MRKTYKNQNNMFDLDGECNGFNIYDHDWDEYNESEPPSGFFFKSSKFQWKTKDGKILSLPEMSNKHIENSIRYEYKRRGKYTHSCEILESELKRRHDENFFKRTRECPFCNKTMKIIETAPEIEVGFSFPKYQFICECGATSNYIKREYYKNIKL